MSDKFTKIFAIFALLFLAGIMISAILPDSKQEDLAVPDAVSEVLSSASDTEKAEESRQAEEIQTGPYLYYYNALSPEEQTVYDQMYEAIIARKEVKLDTKDKEVGLSLKDQVEQELGVTVEYVDALSLSVACHIGPGALAVACSVEY